ncbi:MAG: hypothetical protein GXP24_00830 [Planctomycetes bacterium]|nr:hypothetical protein [Planctomycetota bacterium]
MRYSILAIGLFTSWLAYSAAAYAEEVASETTSAPITITPELVEAHHAYQLAQLRWQRYRFAELPRQRQRLDDQVRLLESELQVLKRRLRDYRPFLQVGRYSPVRTAAENNRLALQATEQQLKLLKHERIHLMRFSHQNTRLYQLDVLRTAARVRQIVAEAQ